MRLAWIVSVVLLSSAIPSSAAGRRSNLAAVSLIAHVAPVLHMQASNLTASGAAANIVSTGQNAFTLEFTMNEGEAALIQVPIVMRTNTNEVLLKASMEGATSGYVQMDGAGAIASSLSSRPMPLGPNVTFAMASGLFRTSAVGAPLPGTIIIAMPPGAVPSGERARVQITMEALGQ